MVGTFFEPYPCNSGNFLLFSRCTNHINIIFWFNLLFKSWKLLKPFSPGIQSYLGKDANSNYHSCIYSLFTAGFCNSSTQLGLSSQPSMRRSILAFAHLHLKHCHGLGTQDPITWRLSSQFLWYFFPPSFFDAFSKTISSTVGPPMK